MGRHDAVNGHRFKVLSKGALEKLKANGVPPQVRNPCQSRRTHIHHMHSELAWYSLEQVYEGATETGHRQITLTVVVRNKTGIGWRKTVTMFHRTSAWGALGT